VQNLLADYMKSYKIISVTESKRSTDLFLFPVAFETTQMDSSFECCAIDPPSIFYFFKKEKKQTSYRIKS
jgi:hypothetical protein